LIRRMATTLLTERVGRNNISLMRERFRPHVLKAALNEVGTSS